MAGKDNKGLFYTCKKGVKLQQEVQMQGEYWLELFLRRLTEQRTEGHDALKYGRM